MNPLDSLVASIERFDRLDGFASSLAGVVGKAVQPRAVRNILSGTVIGHPIHPLLTDIPIGAWSMAAILDTVGGRTMEPAADLLVSVGIAAAVPTAAAGLNDWSDTQGKPRRVGLVHAAANSLALGLYTASAVARSKGNRGLGTSFGLASLVPILPYLLLPASTAIWTSLILSGLVVFGIGVVKARWTKRNPIGSGLEVVALAAFGGIAGYFFGSLLPGLLGVAGISAL